MSVFDDGNDNHVWDYLKYMDYLFGILCVLQFLLSTPLNVVLIGFYRKRKTFSSKLHLLLSAMYLTATILLPLVMAYHFFNNLDAEDAPMPLILLSCGLAGLGVCCGGSILTVISITRLHSLKYPLRRLGKKMRIFLVVLALGLGVIQVFLMFVDGKLPGKYEFNFDSKKQFLMVRVRSSTLVTNIVLRFSYVITAFINISVCALTAYVISPRRSPVKIAGGDQNRQKRSTVTILYMNMIYSVSILYMAVMILLFFILGPEIKSSDSFHILSYVCFPFVPLSLSVLNPLVMICRGKDIRTYAKSIIMFKPYTSQVTSHASMRLPQAHASSRQL